MLLPCTETRALGRPLTATPLIIALHWLGGSARTWQPLADRLATAGLSTAALNLPGFGTAVDLPGYSGAQMADAVHATVATLLAETPGRPWLLAGHSMGGKLAAIVARRALDGAPELANLQAVLLFSPSPPSPEPMEDSTREENLRQLGHCTGDANEDRKRAAKFVHDNVGKLSLPPTLDAVTVDDVQRMNRAAFRAWMQHGSREDWSAQVGTLELPALIFAGESEAALGPDVQREVTLPHYPRGRVVPVAAAGHLTPIERTAEAASHIIDFLDPLGLVAFPTPPLPQLLATEHTSAATRAVLEQRLATPPSPLLDADLLGTLRALAASIVPSAGFDLAAQAAAAIAGNEGDGWRPADLPADADAFTLGLRSLDAAAGQQHSVSFLALDDDRRHALLTLAASGKLDTRSLAGRLRLGSTAQLYNATQMQLWFEEMRGLITRLYMADPRTYARVGFTGFADDPTGFTHIRLGEKDERA